MNDQNLQKILKKASEVYELIKEKFDLNDAQKRVEVLHAGQMYGNKPYIEHIKDVVVIIYFLTKVERDRSSIRNLLIAGLFHDSIEDTIFTKKELTKIFGVHVSDVVSFATNLPNKTRKENISALVEKIRDITIDNVSDLDSLIIKMADGIANRYRCEDSEKVSLGRRYKRELMLLSPAYTYVIGKIPVEDVYIQRRVSLENALRNLNYYN